MNAAFSKTILITQAQAKEFRRLDHLLEAYFQGEYNRTQLKKMFELGLFSMEGNIIGPSKKPQKGNQIIFTPPKEDLFRKEELTAKAQPIPLEVLYQDEDLALINKPVGLVTHPAPGHPENTLVNAILHLFGPIQTTIQSFRPGIVHRLDQGTSGVMVVAKHAKSQELLIELFSKHELVRKYQALCMGIPNQKSGKLESIIGRDTNNRQKMKAYNINSLGKGKKALTHFNVISAKNNFSHLELTLETGRTHQIRVHLSQLLGTPILMDPLYSHPARHLIKLPDAASELLKNYPFPLLHACYLQFIHPIKKISIEYNLAPPELFGSIKSILAL